MLKKQTSRPLLLQCVRTKIPRASNYQGIWARLNYFSKHFAAVINDCHQQNCSRKKIFGNISRIFIGKQPRHNHPFHEFWHSNFPVFVRHNEKVCCFHSFFLYVCVTELLITTEIFREIV